MVLKRKLMLAVEYVSRLGTQQFVSQSSELNLQDVLLKSNGIKKKKKKKDPTVLTHGHKQPIK